MPDIKETTIIRLLETGDERCMKMMFDTYYQALCTYVMRYLISVEDAEDIIQNDNLLEFYMEVSFNADEVFGTDVCTSENDDWLNIYANYDLEARRVCDTLELYLQRGNGDEEAFKYRLSEAECALLLPKMEEYCHHHWGQGLAGCCAQYEAEKMQMNGPAL